MGQRVSRIAGGYEEANDANPLGKDPRFKMGVGRSLLEEDLDLARAATFSGRENVATSQDLYRRAQVLVDKFIGCYSRVAIVIVLDLDHAEDETHGPQEFSFHNHHHHGDRPRFLFEGLWGKFIPAVLRAGRGPRHHDYS